MLPAVLAAGAVVSSFCERKEGPGAREVSQNRVKNTRITDFPVAGGYFGKGDEIYVVSGKDIYALGRDGRIPKEPLADIVKAEAGTPEAIDFFRKNYSRVPETDDEKRAVLQKNYNKSLELRWVVSPERDRIIGFSNIIPSLGYSRGEDKSMVYFFHVSNGKSSLDERKELEADPEYVDKI